MKEAHLWVILMDISLITFLTSTAYMYSN
ncbi:hypothetical protein ViPhICP3M1_gp12 [Vibrio phage ICP3]|nr:hypothetical protein ViPhICP3M1_gp12 [Vibrio phage ICP3]USS70665.1 hypothetical protein ViPhICP3M2_gp12 [Vibrio phage ICP3]